MRNKTCKATIKIRSSIKDMSEERKNNILFENKEVRDELLILILAIKADKNEGDLDDWECDLLDVIFPLLQKK